LINIEALFSKESARAPAGVHVRNDTVLVAVADIAQTPLVPPIVICIVVLFVVKALVRVPRYVPVAVLVHTIAPIVFSPNIVTVGAEVLD
jgi:hypothetical protein